jgi:hypothetical protein
MGIRNRLLRTLLAGSMLAAWPVLAADVTPERLINADKEPQNWLMNHRTYDAQRYSPINKINKDNIKDLKLAYAVAIGSINPCSTRPRRPAIGTWFPLSDASPTTGRGPRGSAISQTARPSWSAR